jgi:hypothetical protein
MKYCKYSIFFLFLMSYYNCFCQNQTISDDQLLKVVKIDSTDNFFFIFLSKSIDTSSINISMPSLTKKNDCNSYYSVDNKRMSYYILLSYKNKYINRNIETGDVLDFSQISPSKLYSNISSTICYTHLGYGEYIEENQNLIFIYPKEVLGLYYTKNSDTITYFNTFKEQMSYFDSSMLKIWMNFSKSETCYKAWLNEIISESQQIEIGNIDNYLVFYENDDCLIPSREIHINDSIHDKTIRLTMFYKTKHSAFVKIGDSLNTFYGWIKI